MPKKSGKRPDFTQLTYTYDEMNGYVQMAIKTATEETINVYAPKVKLQEQRIAQLEFEKEVLSDLVKRYEKELEEAKTPKQRGRPRTPEKQTIWLGNMECWFDGRYLHLPPLPKNGGRPEKYPNMLEKITQWDVARINLATKLNKKTISDIELIRHILKNDKTLTPRKMREAEKEMRSTIKQFRDKTGIRIHKRKKAENLL